MKFTNFKKIFFKNFTKENIRQSSCRCILYKKNWIMFRIWYSSMLRIDKNTSKEAKLLIARNF